MNECDEILINAYSYLKCDIWKSIVGKKGYDYYYSDNGLYIVRDPNGWIKMVFADNEIDAFEKSIDNSFGK